MARIAGAIFRNRKKSNHMMKIIYQFTVKFKKFISFSSTKNFSEMNWYSNDIVEETFKNVVDIELKCFIGKLSNELKH